MSAYLCKMAIDGCIIQVDYTEAKELTTAVSRVAADMNQLCRRINATGHFCDDDIAEMKQLMGQIWDLLKAQQKEKSILMTLTWWDKYCFGMLDLAKRAGLDCT